LANPEFGQRTPDLIRLKSRPDDWHMTRKKKKALYALAMLGFFGCGLIAFVLAADEQSMISSGLPAAAKISLQDLVTQGSGKNKHVELVDFYLGKSFIYTTELVQFNEVYVPMFARGEPEDGSNLHLLLLIRNDRNSNEPLIQTREELGRFVAEFNREPRSVTGVLRKPTDRVRSLTAEAYPGTNGQSLQVLWTRTFPTQDSVNILWSICALCLAGTAVCAVIYRRHRGKPEDTQIVLDMSAAEAAVGKEVPVTIPERHETITAKVPAGVRDGARLRFKGKGRPGKNGEPGGDLYILLRVK
jgi:DnaJ C terminal domain